MWKIVCSIWKKIRLSSVGLIIMLFLAGNWCSFCIHTLPFCLAISCWLVSSHINFTCKCTFHCSLSPVCAKHASNEHTHFTVTDWKQESSYSGRICILKACPLLCFVSDTSKRMQCYSSGFCKWLGFWGERVWGGLAVIKGIHQLYSHIWELLINVLLHPAAI